MSGSTAFDLVVFWKQNDSGIYGRRSDLLIEEIARSDRVARTIHFDAPIGRRALESLRASGEHDHGRLVHESTTDRISGAADEPGFVRRTWLFDDGGVGGLAQVESLIQEYGDFIEDVLAENGVGQRPIVFWVYPSNTTLPPIIDRFRPDLVVADIVDDNRTWFDVGSPRRRQLTLDYAAILSRSDVVLTNCEGNRETMSEFRDDIEIIPNACEVLSPSSTASASTSEALPRPAELGALDGPIIGYAGNLSSRIDVELIEFLARTRPSWNIVLIGSLHAGQAVMCLDSLPNVFLLGPRRHDDAKRYIAHFDVGIIPHLDNEMTKSMQPLKAFVYLSLGVPVVSTHIANLGDLGDHISIAKDPLEFLSILDARIDAGTTRADGWRLESVLRANSWPVRAARALQLIDDALVRARLPRLG